MSISQKKLTDSGKDALEEIQTWIINILIDWANFDQIICTWPLGNEKTLQDENNNNEGNGLKEPDSDLDKHDVVQMAACSSKLPIYKSWKPEEVKKLIDLKVKNEYRFNKPGNKKKIIWQDIADNINKNGSSYTFTQCEQKWKNLTKLFRDTVDHNSRSGNDVKHCPYFREMEEAYGYKANVKPVFTMSSAEPVTLEDASTGSDVESLNDTCNSVSADDGQRVVKKKAKKNEVIMFLETMNEEMKEEQKELLSEIKEQHKAKMKKEDKKIELMAQIIENMKK